MSDPRSIDELSLPQDLKDALIQFKDIFGMDGDDAVLQFVIGLVEKTYNDTCKCDNCEKHEPGNDCYEYVCDNPPTEGY